MEESSERVPAVHLDGGRADRLVSDELIAVIRDRIDLKVVDAKEALNELVQ